MSYIFFKEAFLKQREENVYSCGDRGAHSWHGFWEHSSWVRQQVKFFFDLFKF